MVKWILDTGAGLDVVNSRVAGVRVTSACPPLLTAGGIVRPTEAAELPFPEIGETIRAVSSTIAPNVLSIGRRCAQQGYGFRWMPWAEAPEFILPDGTIAECYVDGNYVPKLRRGDHHLTAESPTTEARSPEAEGDVP